MKRSIAMKNTLIKGLVLGTLTLAAGTAGAVDYYLATKAYTKRLPDGSDVPMWGYVEDTGGACYGAADAVTRLACINALPAVPESPGPRLTVDPGETALRIFLSNGLPEPTSVVITGQELPFSNGTNNGPTFVRPNGDAFVGNRADLGNPNVRRQLVMRSYGREAAANGGSENYVWNNTRATAFDKAGTFIYHSGTDPQKQVYMGLAGLVTKDAVAGEAYPGAPYSQEQVLFYSEIDPELNAAISAGTLETAIHYHARWFLVNGEPYSTICTDGDADTLDDLSGYPCGDMAQTADLTPVPAMSPTLLRFASVAGETHVPTLQGMHMTIVAEDGNPYTWDDGVTTGSAARRQYSVMLPPLKTKDAIIEPTLEGRYAIYDGNGYMTNPTSPDDYTHQDPVGGMLRFLSVTGGVNQAPIPMDDGPVQVVEGRSVTIDVLANDSDPEGSALAISNVDDTTLLIGTVACNGAVGTCDYTSTGGTGIDIFSYEVTDGTNFVSPVYVTVDVVSNAAPVANPDPAATDLNTPVVVNVLANDTDGNGDVLTIASFDAASTLGGTVDCLANGDCTYTPPAGATAGSDDTFGYVATDGYLNSMTGTVTVALSDPAPNVNVAPVANADNYSIGEANVLIGNVLANDTDADGDILTAALAGPIPASAAPDINVDPQGDFPGPGDVDYNGNGIEDVDFILNSDGTFRYHSIPDFTGTVTFDYTASDAEFGSNATVTINVTAVNDVPVAVNDTIFLNSMETTSIAAPGPLANDTDADGDTLTAGNGVPNAGTLTLNADGSFEYTPQGGIANVSVGSVATFTYEASDGISTSAPATVDLRRHVAVTQAVCEFRANRCDWVIEGSTDLGGGMTVTAHQPNGTEFARGITAADGSFLIEEPGSRFRPQTGTRPIDIRVSGVANAEIVDYPIVRQ
jgi:FtsP/CotA-like multicopper oxidase with cupredoxin domain